MTNNSEVVSGSAKAATAGRVLIGGVLVAGAAQAEKIVLGKLLSFWGGYDSQAGKIMVMAHAKGSSSSSSVLAEVIRNGTGPVGIVLRERDFIISIGAIVAAELYNLDVPVVCLEPAPFDEVVSAPGPLRIEAVGGEGGARVYLDSR